MWVFRQVCLMKCTWFFSYMPGCLNPAHMGNSALFVVRVQFTANAGKGLAAAHEQRTLRRRRVHREPRASLPQDVGSA